VGRKADVIIAEM